MIPGVFSSRSTARVHGFGGSFASTVNILIMDNMILLCKRSRSEMK